MYPDVDGHVENFKAEKVATPFTIVAVDPESVPDEAVAVMMV
jgi:hypothetical protein